MKEKQREAMIEEVLDAFDFDKVHKVMTMLDWYYAIPDQGEFVEMVPTHYMLIKTANKLLREVSQYEDKQRHEIATGGFRAVFDEDEDLELRFEIETSVSFTKDYDEEGNYIYNHGD